LPDHREPGAFVPRVRGGITADAIPALVTGPKRLITVALADAEPLIREALGQVLGMRGLSLLARPRAPQTRCLHAPASRILILTRTEQNRVVEAIVAGACGYILKTAPRGVIIAAVRATAAGESGDLTADRRQASTTHPRTRHPNRIRWS
jgi:hypothetical protein